jgi:hypothetical protein
MDPDRRRSAFRVLLGLSSEAVRVARMLANDPDPALRKEALAILPARETG